MDSLFDLLKNKADKIDIDRALSEIELAQAEVDRYADGKAHVSKFSDDGKLFVITQSSALAGELRLQQLPIISAVSKVTKRKVSKLIIQIR